MYATIKLYMLTASTAVCMRGLHSLVYTVRCIAHLIGCFKASQAASHSHSAVQHMTNAATTPLRTAVVALHSGRTIQPHGPAIDASAERITRVFTNHRPHAQGIHRNDMRLYVATPRVGSEAAEVIPQCQIALLMAAEVIPVGGGGWRRWWRRLEWWWW